jgi:hypothetical protein
LSEVHGAVLLLQEGEHRVFVGAPRGERRREQREEMQEAVLCGNEEGM